MRQVSVSVEKAPQARSAKTVCLDTTGSKAVSVSLGSLHDYIEWATLWWEFRKLKMSLVKDEWFMASLSLTLSLPLSCTVLQRMSAMMNFSSVWMVGLVFRTRSAFVHLTSRASCVSRCAAMVRKAATAVLRATSASWLCCSASSPTTCSKPVPSALVLASVLNLGPKPQSRSVSQHRTEPRGQRRGHCSPEQASRCWDLLGRSMFLGQRTVPGYSRLHTDDKLLAHLLASLNTRAERSTNSEINKSL